MHGKKAALSLAIAKSKGEIIVTTDADCLVRKNWLRVISYAYDTQHIKLATAPVVFTPGSNVVENYQVLDLAGMMAVTASGIFNKTYYLANGANMSFTREVFDELNGFEGNEQYASGDDMFLIHKLAKENPDAVSFLKTTAGTVTPQSESTFKNLLQQRKRWATKSKAYSDRSLQILLVFIFMFNLLIVANVLLSFWLGEILFFIALLMLLFKFTMDYLFLKNMTSYFDRRKSMKAFFPASLLSIFIILYSGWVSIFSKTYVWKGRKTQ